MPVTPRGRGRRIALDMPEVKPGEEKDPGYVKAAKQPPAHLPPKKLAYGPINIWSLERRLSTSEEKPIPHDSKSHAQPNEEFLEKQYSESPEKYNEKSLKKRDDSSPDKQNETFSETDTSYPDTQSEKNLDTQSESLNTTENESLNSTFESETLYILGTESEQSVGTQSERSGEKHSDDEPLTLFKADLYGKPFLICAAQFLCNPETTKELVIEWIEYVMRRSLTSTDFCITFASHLRTLSRHIIFGKFLKTVTIDYLQENYEERNTSFEDKPADFNGSVSLLGQIFLRYRNKGNPLKVFAEPLLECLLMMCNSPNQQNLKIVAEQISLNGRALKIIAPETMMQFIVTVQRLLLDTASDDLRTWLLLITNLCLYGQPLCPEICEVFAKSIGLNTIKEMAPPTDDKLRGEITDEFLNEFGNSFSELI